MPQPPVRPGRSPTLVSILVVADLLGESGTAALPIDYVWCNRGLVWDCVYVLDLFLAFLFFFELRTQSSHKYVQTIVISGTVQ